MHHLPLVTGYVFDALIPSSDRGQVVQLMGALIAVTIASTMFTMARSMAALRLESRADSSLEAAVWDRALNLPATFFKQYTSGDLASRLGAINTIRETISGTTLGSILTGVFSLLNVALLFYYDTKLAILGVGLVLGAALLTFALGFLTLRYQRQMVESSGTLSGLVLEYLRGVAKLRVTGSEARAIVHRPRIIFFDEATSALDNRSQETVTQSLNQLRATRIVIAHRLSTVINADRIIVMDKGRIAQVGDYKSLIDVPGIFQDLARRQML